MPTLVRSDVSPTRRKYLDILERVFWTAVQAASAVGIVDWFEWDEKWIAPIAIGLAVLKSVAGTAIGNKATGSTLPADYDPATPPVAPVVSDDPEAGYSAVEVLLCVFLGILIVWALTVLF